MSHPDGFTLSPDNAAVDAVRPICSTFSVQSPSVVSVSVSFAITVDSSGSKLALIAPVEAAVASYVNNLPVGATLSSTRVASIAYGVSPSIVNVTSLSLNGSAGDLVASPTSVIVAASVSVS